MHGSWSGPWDPPWPHTKNARTLEHEPQCLARHGARVEADAGRRHARPRGRHQVRPAGDVAAAGGDGATRRLYEAAHRQVCAHLPGMGRAWSSELVPERMG